MRHVGGRMVLVFAVAASLLVACTQDHGGSEGGSGTNETLGVAALIMAAVQPTPGQSRASETKCLEKGLAALETTYGTQDQRLGERLAAFAAKRSDADPLLLRDALLNAGVPESEAEALYTGCDLAYSNSQNASTTTSPTVAPSSSPPVTSGQGFPDALLALIVESTKGMVPEKAQTCYRDALLGALPYGADTVVEIAQPITKDSLQQVLGTLGITVEKQGELLGNCMMAG